MEHSFLLIPKIFVSELSRRRSRVWASVWIDHHSVRHCLISILPDVWEGEGDSQPTGFCFFPLSPQGMGVTKLRVHLAPCKVRRALFLVSGKSHTQGGIWWMRKGERTNIQCCGGLCFILLCRKQNSCLSQELSSKNNTESLAWKQITWSAAVLCEENLSHKNNHMGSPGLQHQNPKVHLWQPLVISFTVSIRPGLEKCWASSSHISINTLRTDTQGQRKYSTLMFPITHVWMAVNQGKQLLSNKLCETRKVITQCLIWEQNPFGFTPVKEWCH